MGVILALVGLFTVVAAVVLRFVVSPGGVAALRPESGVLLAILLLLPRRRWVAMITMLWALETAVEVSMGGVSFLVGGLLAFALAGQAVLAALILSGRSGGSFRLDSPRRVFELFVWGCGVPSLVFGVLPLMVGLLDGQGHALIAYVSWAASSCLGVGVVTPLLLEWLPHPIVELRAMERGPRRELGAALVVTGTVMWAAFMTSNPAGADLARFAYLAFPLVVWVAIRLGAAATSVALAVMVPIAVFADILDPSYATDVGAAFASTAGLQAFLVFVAALGYTLAALEAQRATAAVGEAASRAAALEGEERFRALFHSSPVPLRMADFSGVVARLHAVSPGRPDEALRLLTDEGVEPRELLEQAVITEANQASAELIGMDQAALLGPLVGQPTVVGSSRSVAFEILQAIALGKAEVTVSGELVRPDGGVRYVQLKLIIPHPAGRPDYEQVVAAMIDVTDVEEGRRRALELSDLKSRLIATVAHELRTPLTAVVGFAELLEASRPNMGEPEVDDMVADIAMAGRQMGAIVEDLLTSARADLGTLAIQPRATRLAAEVRAALRTTVVEGRDITFAGEETEAAVDAGRFRQIVRNLVTNAVRHGLDPIEISLGRRDSLAVLTVCDAGPVISPPARERLFDLYWWGSESGGTSLGIGLNLSRELARMMGGDLTYARLHERNVFELTLPLNAEETCGQSG
jgi:signal transduction histidine kinase/integral membrane sensor domain MASE1